MKQFVKYVLATITGLAIMSVLGFILFFVLLGANVQLLDNEITGKKIRGLFNRPLQYAETPYFKPFSGAYIS